MTTLPQVQEAAKGCHLSQVYKASALAKEGLKEQFDKAGVGIYEHVQRVALAVAFDGYDYTHEIVAVLHDSVEDTDLTVEQVRAQFGDTVADAVDAITHRDGETYKEYLARCRLNPIARVVKLADIADNADPARIAAILCPTTRKRFTERYKMAGEVMGRPVRLQLSRAKGFNLQEHSRAMNGLPAISVARPHKWGNPFPVGAPGPMGRVAPDNEGASGFFRAMFGDLELWDECNYPKDLSPLAGHNLACFCGLQDHCHADVLIELANSSEVMGAE